MKKIFLLKITLISILLFFGFSSCNIDPYEQIGINDKPLPKNVRIYHLNPITGVEYTEEELANLGYDPFKGESYLIDDPVDLYIRSSKKPMKVEIAGGGAVLETITEFTPITTDFGEEFESAKFSTTVINLGMEEGQTKTLEIKSTYDVGGGFAVSSLFYNVNYKGDISGINSGFQLVGKDAANTRFLALNPNKERDLQFFESNRMGYTYDGTSQYATIPDPYGYLDFRYDKDFSIGFWVRTTSTDDDPEIIADQNWDNGRNPGITVAFKDGVIQVIASDGGPNSSNSSYLNKTNTKFNDGAWHYLAITFKRGENVIAYLDGVEDGKAEFPATVGNIKSGHPLRIAQDGPGTYGQFFEGDVADVKIFDYALSSEEVIKLSGEPKFPLMLATSSGEKTLNFKPSGDVEVQTFDNGLKGWDFNGTSQYVTIEDEGQLDFRYDQDFSFSFWVNTTSTDDDPEIIADQNWDNGRNPGITVAFKDGVIQVIASDGGPNSGNSSYLNKTSTKFNDGAWHLVTITFERGGNVIAYLDGIEDGKAPYPSTVGNIKSGHPLRIAQDGPGTYGQYFQGKVAGTIIHDHTLSPAEVLALYNN